MLYCANNFVVFLFLGRIYVEDFVITTTQTDLNIRGTKILHSSENTIEHGMQKMDRADATTRRFLRTTGVQLLSKMSKSTTTHKKKKKQGQCTILDCNGNLWDSSGHVCVHLAISETPRRSKNFDRTAAVNAFFVLLSSYPKPKHKYYRDTGVAPRVILIGVSEIMP